MDSVAVAGSAAAVARQEDGDSMSQKQIIDEDAKLRIEDGIVVAESSTSGEIVVCLAQQSSGYERSEDVLSLIAATISIIIIWIGWQSRITDEWGGNYLYVDLFHVLIAGLIGIIFSKFIIHVIYPRAVLALVSLNNREKYVSFRASHTFLQRRVHHTRGETGILIYVSLLEQIVHIIGDDKIDEKVEEGSWDLVRDAVLEGIKSTDIEAGLINGIKKVGEILSENFPNDGRDEDELPNELIILGRP